METYIWYQALLKPSWAPPAEVFGPVWAILYIIIAISFGTALVLFIKKEMPFAVLLPFFLNLVFNLLFSPIQFILQSNLLAMLDIFLVLATLIWVMKAVYPYHRWITYAQIPYLLWVSFATVLQISITYLNW